VKTSFIAAVILAASTAQSSADILVFSCKGMLGTMEREIGLVYIDNQIYFDGSVFEMEVFNKITLNAVKQTDQYTADTYKSFNIDRITGTFTITYFESVDKYLKKPSGTITIDGVERFKAAEFKGVCRKADFLL